jgi:hypothetical protein
MCSTELILRLPHFESNKDEPFLPQQLILYTTSIAHFFTYSGHRDSPACDKAVGLGTCVEETRQKELDRHRDWK